MKRFLATLLIALVAACTTTITPSGAVAVAYEQVRVFQVQVKQTAARGVISVEKARSLNKEGDKALATVKQAEDALVLCGAKPKCFEVDQLLTQATTQLAEAERQLRAQEGKK